MKKLTTIRTSNWKAMTSFYAEKLALGERSHDDQENFRDFNDFGTEIHLEKVQTNDQHEVCGALELYSNENLNHLADYLIKKGIEVQKRVIEGETVLMFLDPDGNRITIVKEK